MAGDPNHGLTDPSPRKLSGEFVARWLLIAWVAAAAVLWVAIPVVWQQGGALRHTIPFQDIRRTEVGGLWTVLLSQVRSMNLPEANASGHGDGFFFAQPDEPPPLRLFEDGRPLGPELPERRKVTSQRAGSFSRYEDRLYFSTPDETNPRKSKHVYWFSNDLEPRVEPLPLLALVALWGLLGSSIVVAIRRRKAWVSSVVGERPRGSGPELLVVFLLTMGYTAALDLTGTLAIERSVVLLLGMAALASLAAVLLRAPPRWRAWMGWLASFGVWAAVRWLLDPQPLDAQNVIGRFGLALALGSVAYFAWSFACSRVGPKGALVLLPWFGLLSLASILENLGFDWDGLLGWACNLPILEVWDTHWNMKFLETWVFFGMWVLVGCCWAMERGTRRLSLLAAVLAAGFLASGYSKSVKLSLIVSLVVFALARWRPRQVRLAVTALMVSVLIGAPIWAALGWNAYRAAASSVDARPILESHLSPRLVTWGYASDKIRERPLLGWGVGAGTADAFMRQPAVEVWDQASTLQSEFQTRPVLPGGHPHNAALQIWFETGAVGVALAVGLLLSVLRLGRRWRSREGQAAHLSLVTSVVLVFSLNYPLFAPAPVFLLFAVASLCGLATDAEPAPQ